MSQLDLLPTLLVINLYWKAMLLIFGGLIIYEEFKNIRLDPHGSLRVSTVMLFSVASFILLQLLLGTTIDSISMVSVSQIPFNLGITVYFVYSAYRVGICRRREICQMYRTHSKHPTPHKGI